MMENIQVPEPQKPVDATDIPVAPSTPEAPKPAASWEMSGIEAERDDPLLSCLIFLTRLENNPFSADALTAGLPIVDNKLSPDLFIRAAERAGLSAQIVKRPLQEISSLVLPAVLLLKDKKCCVLLEHSAKNMAKIIQPESLDGTREIKRKDLEDSYTGYVIFARPSYRFDSRAAEQHLDTSKHWFWSVVAKTWPIYAEVMIASVFINIFAIVSSLFTMNVYDRVVPNNAIDTLWVLAIGVMAIYTFDFILKMLRSYFIDVAGKKCDLALSAKIFEQMMGMKMEARPESVGGFANTMQQFEGFRDFMTSTTITTFIDLPFLLFFVVVMFSLGGVVAFIPLVAIPFVLICSLWVQKLLDGKIKESQKFITQKQSMLYECLAGVETIKSTTAEGVMQRKWEHLGGSAAAISGEIKVLQQISANFSMWAQQIVGVFVVVIGVERISENLMTMGALVACTILSGRALAPLSQVAGLLTRYQQSISSMKSVDNMMTMAVERPSNKKPLHRPSLEGKVEFKDVSFQYPRQQVNSLEAVSFSIEPGEKVGIIGRIGSGKTTLEKLLMGFYEPTEGSILLDGLELRQLDITTVRRNIGYIPQDINLFFGSVKENIVFGSPYVNDEAILAAANIAGVTDFASRHPKGFDMPVGERGERLSGGQRQAIAAARALLLNPPIFLFDEPTNMMDNRTEEMFKTHIASMVGNKTLILITHKGAMLSLVNRVIVMDNGKVVSDGPRDKVLQALMAGQLQVK